jgi:aminoglycoside phosphotransferase (APT) family kinase protein
LELADTTRTKLVLRRARDADDFEDAHRMARHFKTLQLLQQAGVPAPLPLFLDVEGAYFDTPSLLMTYLGEPLVAPKNVSSWLAQLAGALVKLHQITPRRFDLSHLESFSRSGFFERIEQEPRGSIAGEPLAKQVAALLKKRFPTLAWPEQVLIHRDFWPGNTVWRRGRLAGIIDSPNARLGDPRIDVAMCRVDLSMMHGLDVADGFLEAYQTAANKRLDGQWFFDLYGALRALPELRSFEQGYVDLGLAHLTQSFLESRLRAFVE